MDTILVVDDEEDLADLIVYQAEKNGFRGVKLTSGLPVLETARELQPALIILDLMLPGVDGLEVFRRLRRHERTRHIPVIMLTARAEEVDRIVGLELGADDYIAKPFSVRELMLRVRAVVRRVRPTEEAAPMVHRAGPITLDAEAFNVEVGGASIKLTAIEFKLLQELMARRGRVLRREHLLSNVWGYTHFGSLRTVDTHVRRLRAKLGDAADLIETVRGVGYRFVESPTPGGSDQGGVDDAPDADDGAENRDDNGSPGLNARSHDGDASMAAARQL